MLKTAFTVLGLPGRATRRALQTATSPSSVNALSAAIAQGSIQTARSNQDVSIDGLTIDITFNEQRLLATGGIASAIAFGTVYWLGSKLDLQYRYNAIADALQLLQSAIDSKDAKAVEEGLQRIDELSDPLRNPRTLEPIDNVDEVKAIYQQVMKQEPKPGTLFNASKLTTQIDDAVSLGTRASTLLAAEAVEDGVKAMRNKAVGLAGTTTSRVVGRLLWVDTVYWLGTSAIDIGLDYLGVPEQAQKIPFLSDIPGIGGLFDFSDGLGASAVDLVLTPILEGVFDLLGLGEVQESLIEILWGIILSAALNPTLTPFIIAILDFYIEDIALIFDVPAMFPINATIDFDIDLYAWFRPEPLDVLIAWTYLCVGKVIFKAWVKPMFDVVIGSLEQP